MVGDMGDEIGLVSQGSKSFGPGQVADSRFLLEQPIRGSPDVEADSLVSLQVKTHEGAPAFYVLFDLADLIHSGGYGKVYRVHKKGDPNTIYAMKIAKGGAAALQVRLVINKLLAALKHSRTGPRARETDLARPET